MMYEITVRWPDGRVITNSGYNDERSLAIMDLLWAAGADDVFRRCICGECETCHDRGFKY